MIMAFPLGRALRSIPSSEPVLRHLFNIWYVANNATSVNDKRLTMARVSVAYLNYVFDDPRVLLFLCGSAVATYFIAKYIPGGNMPWIGMAFSMTMLAISRNDRVFSNVDYVFVNPNLSQPQMMLTMKLISFCWNVRDGKLPLARTVQYQRDRAIRKIPGLLEFASYVLFFPGLFSEPFLDFNDFRQYMTGATYAQSKSSEAEYETEKRTSSPDNEHLSGSNMAAVRKGFYGLALFTLFYVLSNRYTVDLLSDSNVTKTHNLPSRILLLHVILFTTRVRAYGIWALSEGIYIATGLGYNGVDPLTRQSRWDKIRNADFLGVEFSDCPKQYLRSWNMTVAAWLRHYVYERISTPGKKSGFFERTATLAFSALWHGFEPGFYVSFVGVSVLQCAIKGTSGFFSVEEWTKLTQRKTDICKLPRPSFFAPICKKSRSASHNITSALLLGPWTVMRWLLCQILLDYAIVPFLAGSFSDIFRIWSNLSFYGTIVVLAILVSTRGPKLLRSSEWSETQVPVKHPAPKAPADRFTLAEKSLNMVVKKYGLDRTNILIRRTRFEK